MSAPPKVRLTPEEYLAYERQAETKSEYFDGEVYAMAGASEKHHLIVANVVGELYGQLRKRPCKVYPSDMRLKVGRTGLYQWLLSEVDDLNDRVELSAIQGILALADMYDKVEFGAAGVFQVAGFLPLGEK